MEELKKCPFCGGKAMLIRAREWYGYYSVGCSKCGIETNLHDTPAEAIAAWNRRSNDERTPDTF